MAEQNTRIHGGNTGWKRIKDPSGKWIYMNERLRLCQWEVPEESTYWGKIQLPGEDKRWLYVNRRSSTGHSGHEISDELKRKIDTQESETDERIVIPEIPVMNDWKKARVIDPDPDINGKWIYCNVHKIVAQWEMPDESIFWVKLMNPDGVWIYYNSQLVMSQFDVPDVLKSHMDTLESEESQEQITSSISQLNVHTQ